LTRSREKKVLGLAIGERSLFAAEVAAAPAPGGVPAVVRLAEMVYPPTLTPAQPAEMGKALAQFLRENDFSARAAIVGIPAKWLVVRPKDVPPADPDTLAQMLRLEAEAEFSTELKDMVYDFAAGDGDAARTVLLMGTPRRHVEAAQAMCAAARLRLLAVTPSAVALGAATGRAAGGHADALVLAVAAGGSEMTAQHGATPGAVRHLRAPTPQPAFVSEVRRAMSMMPRPTNGTREIVLWDGAGLDAAALGEQLGLRVRAGDLPALGVTAPDPSANGEGRRYASAVALALAGVGPGGVAVDFLHSRLAAPREARFPRWAVISAVAAVCLVAGAIFAYIDLRRQRAEVAAMRVKADGLKGPVATAGAFVAKVSFAQAWHGGDPRYLACVLDLTRAIPEDGVTYATSLILRETVPGPSRATPAGGSSADVPKPPEVRTLTGQLFAKTADQQRAQLLLDTLRRLPNFRDVKSGGTAGADRGREVSFSVSFTYVPVRQTP